MKQKANHIDSYRKVWENNLQIIEKITKDIEKNLIILEKKSKNITNTYKNVKEQLETLSTIYSSYNNIKGREYVLKLNILLKDYGLKLKENSGDFNTISFILNKIIHLQEKSIIDFPFFEHDFNANIEKVNNSPSTKKKLSEYRFYSKNFDVKTLERKYKYKWICFKRNNVSILASFNTIKIVTYADAVFEKSPISPIDQIILFNRKYYVTDLFLKDNSEKYIKPRYYILINNVCYAADLVTNWYFANKEIFNENVVNLKNKLFHGKIRLKGKNHYFLKN